MRGRWRMPEAFPADTGSRFKRIHDLALILAACTLSVNPNIKIAEVQLLEFLYAADMLLLLLLFLRSDSALRIFRPFFQIGLRWAIFAALALLLALWDLQQDFFYGPFLSPLKHPFWATFSRFVELVMDVFFMLYLASVLREDSRLRKWAAQTYYLVGVAGALYCLVSLPAKLVGITLGAVSSDFRFTGFNPEGGPYGVYLLTVVFLTVVMQNQKWISKRAAVMSYILFGCCLLGSRSKAALMEAAVLAVLGAILRSSGWRILGSLVTTLVILTTLFFILDVPTLFRPYLNAVDQYQQMSALRRTDANYIVGRAAGVFLAPKMIAAHPLVGIGWGNYPIVRDDPQYRHGTPIVDISIDAPALGAIDYIVDFGIPLFLFFSWIEIYPALPLIRARAGFSLTGLILLLPVGRWSGSHLNLTYQWVAAAIGLAIFYANDRRDEPPLAGKHA